MLAQSRWIVKAFARFLIYKDGPDALEFHIHCQRNMRIYAFPHEHWTMFVVIVHTLFFGRNRAEDYPHFPWARKKRLRERIWDALLAGHTY